MEVNQGIFVYTIVTDLILIVMPRDLILAPTAIPHPVLAPRVVHHLLEAVLDHFLIHVIDYPFPLILCVLINSI